MALGEIETLFCPESCSVRHVHTWRAAKSKLKAVSVLSERQMSERLGGFTTALKCMAWDLTPAGINQDCPVIFCEYAEHGASLFFLEVAPI